MTNYAYVRATEQGPWHIVQLGYPGAVFDQPICGSVLCYETWSTETITGEISLEAKTPLCESCRAAYCGLVHFRGTQEGKPNCPVCKGRGWYESWNDCICGQCCEYETVMCRCHAKYLGKKD